MTVAMSVHDGTYICAEQGMQVFLLLSQSPDTFMGLHRSHVLSRSTREMRFWIKKGNFLKVRIFPPLLHSWLKFLMILIKVVFYYNIIYSYRNTFFKKTFIIYPRENFFQSFALLLFHLIRLPGLGY